MSQNYSWTNDTPTIGLAASGSGNISFAAINSTNAPVVSTVTVTPHYSNGAVSCDGPVQTFTLTVNPSAQVDVPSDQTVCNNTLTSSVVFTTSRTGGTTTYTWTNNTTSIGLAASGTGNISDFTANNTGSTPVTATVTVTPHYFNGLVTCDGTPQTFSITVKPTPTVTSLSSLTICSGTSLSYTPTSAVIGATFTWTAQNTIGTVNGYSANGLGAITDILTNTGSGDGQVTYTITPAGPAPNSCPGPSFQLKVNVLNCNPKIGVSQQLVSMNNNGDGTYEALINFRVQNYGNIPLDNIQVTENLTTAFGAANKYAVLGISSASFDVNTSFTGIGNLLDNTGTQNRLDVGASTDIRLYVKILSAGSYTNTVTASSSTSGTASDVSQNGSDPDPDGDADPNNNSVVTPLVTSCSPVMTVSASDGVMCHPNSGFTQSFQIIASAANAASYLWTTDGTGTFSSTTSITPSYTPSASDVQDGQVRLKIVAFSGGICPNVEAEMTLTIWTSPSVDAGPAATICSGNTFTLSGAVALNYSGLTWTTSGTGTFNNSNALNPVYTPSAADRTAGSVILNLTATAKGTCTNTSDNIVLTITPSPTVNAGTDASICSSSASFTLSGSGSNYSTLQWTTSGTGIFTNGTTLTAGYTPSAADIATGQVQLTLTAIGNGNCANVSDIMVLNIWKVPSANAGPNATICSGNNFVLTGATAANYSSITWTSTGGTFNNANSLNPTFTPTSTGPITLTLTATGLGTCSNSSSSMILTVNPAVTLTASSYVNTTCGASSGSVVLTSSDGSTVTLNGTTKASGSTFGGLIAGYYTATSNGSCPSTVSFRISNTTSTLSATITSVTSPLCHNGTGSVVVTGTGGTGSLSYSLDGGASQGSGSFSGVAAGNHTITVSDSNGLYLYGKL